MTERIYKVICIDGRLYLNHHGVSDYIGDEDCTNEKAIIQIGQYLNELTHENEKLKKEKDFWKGDSCVCSSYLSILSMDCQIVQEAIYDLKNVINVNTEAFKLLDELDDKFDKLNRHRIKMYSR